MKKFVTTTFFVAGLLLDSCEPAATFDKAQPDNVKALSAFPGRLQGKYLAADQASIVIISDNLITRHYDFDFKQHKDSIGYSFKIIGDTLINETDGTKEIILLKGDTVIQHANWTDTLFNISADNILKKFRGYYFLNSRYSDNAWEVKMLSLNKGVLTVGGISDKDDIQKLKEITETTADTISTSFSLTRRQFKQFVKQEGFGTQEMFNRMTENGR